ncbi:hypothetical protein KC333_g6156 [Hortaea werneckii]|nr:hypothetical protein KC333_g6156 [Hortaea werneckii]KAI7311932.1 hypothetical protein KC326_g6060 [Hortaea werneckii]
MRSRKINGHAEINGGNTGSEYRQYRDRTSETLRIQTFRNSRIRADEFGTGSRRVTGPNSPRTSHYLSRDRSRSPQRNTHEESWSRQPNLSDVYMGGMTRSRTTRRNWQTGDTRFPASYPETTNDHERRSRYQGMENEYADPYIASSDTPEGLDNLERAEYVPAPNQSQEANTERQVEALIRMLASQKLTPAAIPGHLFRSFATAAKETISQTLNIMTAHASAAVYRQTYGTLDRARNAEKNQSIDVGTIGFGPVIEFMYDFGIGVQDTDRINSTHGPIICDRRPLILLNNTKRGILQVASITSFGGADGNGRGAPPPGKEDEYARLVDELASDHASPSEKRLIACSWTGTKPQGSWVRLSQFHELPSWIPIQWDMGMISAAAHEVLADGFNFAPDHVLRKEGIMRKARQKTTLEAAGGDAAKREERRKRQQRQMEIIRQQEELNKVEKKSKDNDDH